MEMNTNHEISANLSVDNRSYFKHNFGEYSLEARILNNEKGEKPWVFSVHGARSDYAKSDAITVGLQKRGCSILGFNMSGHNDASKISIEQTTLGNNIKEAEAFFSYLNPKTKKKIIAYSLGATPALKVLETHIDEVDRVVLVGPGIYSTQAYDKHFGEEFRSAISRPFSYRENEVIAILEAYKGKLLLIKGEYDGLDPVTHGKPIGTSAGEVEIGNQRYYSPIPKEVIEMIYNAVPSDRRKMVVINGCDHAVAPWIHDHPNEGKSLLDEMALFLNG
ncbi:alpha/beta fold hydrolase [Candidatus Microgenomates bacterium]|nr:alpha/beta fold hydrolase [Candidatus Microgenomates bacterium]